MGNVYEVSLLDDSLCYLQVVSVHAGSKGGEVLRVLPGRFLKPPRDVDVLAAERAEYMVEWMIKPLVAAGRARLVGGAPVPAGEEWSGLYLGHSRTQAGVDIFHILGTGLRTVAVPEVPTAEQLRLPQPWFGPDESLLLVLQHSRDRSWSVSDLNAFRAKLPPKSELVEDATPRHLVVFRSRPAAGRADAALRKKVPGVESEVIDLSGTGTVAWAVRDPAAFEPDADRDSLEGGSLGKTVRALAREHRGTYDGIA